MSDAHLGHLRGEVTAAFHRFLAAVPDMGDHLVVNGDLFDFWCEYRSVIPRACFSTLAALARLRQAGVRLTVTGGNHDRWGADFWSNELDAAFHSRAVELELAGWRAWVAHGDGLAELDLPGKLLHGITGHPWTARVFRWLHPDLGFGLVQRMSQLLAARRGRQRPAAARAAQALADHARKLLAERPDLDLVVLGHTHSPALESVEGQRWYLNPGAWMDGFRYALVSRAGPELRTFT